MFQGITGTGKAIGLAQGHPVSNRARRADRFPSAGLCFIHQNLLLQFLCQRHQSSLGKAFVGVDAAVGCRMDKVFALSLWECEHRAAESNSKAFPWLEKCWWAWWSSPWITFRFCSISFCQCLLKMAGRWPSCQKSNEDLLASHGWKESPRIQNCLIPYSGKKLRGISIPVCLFYRSKIQGCRRMEACSCLESGFQVIVDLRVHP